MFKLRRVRSAPLQMELKRRRNKKKIRFLNEIKAEVTLACGRRHKACNAGFDLDKGTLKIMQLHFGGVFLHILKFRILERPTKLKINAQAEEEALKLEHMFDVWCKPIYARRTEVIKSIREFWLVTFCNHPILGNILTEEDQKIFKNMVSLDVKEADDVKSGFSNSFSFLPNPYFEDEKLTKRYWFDDYGFLSVVCKPINWKEGKGTFAGCCCPDKAGKQSHTFKRCSFFCWFSETVRFDGGVDEIANIIRGDLWPNPLQYFPKKLDAEGLHMQQDSEEVTGGGNEADGEEEEEDDEIEEEESEDRHMDNDKDSGADDKKDVLDNCAEDEVVDDEYDEGYNAEDDENDDLIIIC